MSLFELESGSRERPGQPKREPSRSPRGGSRVPAPVARGTLTRALARWKESVWAPLFLKVTGVVVGMLALAAIGASSIAHGSFGNTVEPAKEPPRLAAGLGPLQPKAPVPAPPVLQGSSTPAGADAGPAPSAAPPDGGPPTEGALTEDGKVILNRAGIDDLQKLPGIGEKRARAILELRQKLGGRFKRISDLLRLKGIGPKGLKKIEAKAVLDG